MEKVSKDLKETGPDIIPYIFPDSKLQFCSLSRLTSHHFNLDLEMFLNLLQSCPKLEYLNLLIQNISLVYSENREPNAMSSTVPACLVLSLEFVELEILTFVYEREMKLLRYFLENSTILEKLTIRLCGDSSIEAKHVEEILTIPRCSSTCQQLESFIETTKPSCLVADMFFPWATQSAEKFGVPRLVFHGTSFFSLCCSYNMRIHKPHKKVSTRSTPFVIPGLPGNIVMTLQQANVSNDETPRGKFMKEVRESESVSFGVLVNSFYKLESTYADFYRGFVAKRAWHIGPLSLCNVDLAEKAGRGKKANVDEQECLRWLESKATGSVVYMSFGSGTSFTNEQLLEIAAGLEGSGQNFIWVVRKNENQGENEEWLPEGFEERTKGKGLIIRGWAPQVLILDHKAVGGFVTHCGWNSVMEGIAAGLPMVTWPMGAEQFYNEKLLTMVLKTGVNVGATELVKRGKLISREEVEKAVREVIVGEEAEERRKRAKKLGEMAKAAVEEGGSSYNDLNKFMEEVNGRK
ncbi:hypothetical protein Bca4012_005029 [Brassica carinata]